MANFRIVKTQNGNFKVQQSTFKFWWKDVDHGSMMLSYKKLERAQEVMNNLKKNQTDLENDKIVEVLK